MDFMKILVLNGPNINMLGIREKSIYGEESYAELCRKIYALCKEKSIECEIFQSNHEGIIIDKIQECYGKKDAVIVNPAAYTHTSIAIADAIKAVGVPTVEVHISDPDSRENFRKVNFVRPACIKTISGKGIDSYLEAIDFLSEYLKNEV